MSDGKVKFLVLNPSPENLPKAVRVANSLNKKNGPFEALLLLGDIISENNGKLPEFEEPSTSVYHVEGLRTFEKQEDERLKFLGKYGVLQLANGLKIGYVTGNLKDVASDELKAVFENQALDMLITYQWPTSISKEEKLTLVGNVKLNCLMNYTKPRYWFAVGTEAGKFFERLPFKWEYQGYDRITRFISLGQHGGSDRWYYAFNLSLDAIQDKDSVTKFGEPPVDASELPSVAISSLLDRKRPVGSDMTTSRHKKEKKQVNPTNCFFCLSNPSVALHMILSIGEFMYITIAKGPLLYKNTHGFSGHGLLIPINHYPTLLKYKEAEEPDVRVENTKLYIEKQSYQSSLVEMFNSLGDYTVVFWEISRAEGIHNHTQFLPIDSKLTEKFDEALKKQVDFNNNKYRSDMKFIKITDENIGELNSTMNTEDYLLITVSKSKSEHVRYLYKLGTDNKPIDLQFSRRVLAFLLKLPKRIYWENCKESLAEETDQKTSFQKAFQPFDFTLKKGT